MGLSLVCDEFFSYVPTPSHSNPIYNRTHCFQKSNTSTTDAVCSRIIHKPYDYMKSCNIVQRVQVFTYIAYGT